MRGVLPHTAIMSTDPIDETKRRMNEVWTSKFGVIDLADEGYQKFAAWSFKKIYSWRKPIPVDILTKYFDEPTVAVEVTAAPKKFNTNIRESMLHVYPMFGMVDGRTAIKDNRKKQQFQEIRSWIISQV